MTRGSVASGYLAVLALVAGCTGSPAGAQDPEVALAIEREVVRIANARVLWPRFDPLAIPLAIYTGERTYLFRHPSPPEGFHEMEGAEPRTFVFQGRFPGVIANSSADLGGTPAATLLAGGADPVRSPAALAAVALHEAFHVFQRAHHPTWSANEADLFLYPIDDARLLGLSRLESAALQRALDSVEAGPAACWADRALAYRRERFDTMDPVFATYERLNELNEGLAAYVELLASEGGTVRFPAGGFPATTVRERAYVTGPAMALLLDRLDDSWQAALSADDRTSLDEMLQAAIRSSHVEGEAPCALATDEQVRIEREAQRDAAAVAPERSERRRRFDALPGWRLVVEAAEGQPLWPQGFDPLNLARVEGGILHTRFLRLGNEAGEFEAIRETDGDLETLTEGDGPHPIFNGVRRATVAGLAEPEVVTEGGQVTVRAPGLLVRFENARVERSGTDVRIFLSPPSREPR